MSNLARCDAAVVPSGYNLPSSLVFSPTLVSLSFLFSFSFPKSRRYTFLAGIMASYNAIDSHAPSPYGSGDPYYNASTGYISPANPKKPLNKWIKIGIPVAILVIAGAVVAGVLASRHHNHNSSSSNTSSGSPAAASSALSAKNAVGIFPTGTDSEYMVPIYPSTVSLTFEIYFRCLICLFARLYRRMQPLFHHQRSTLLAREAGGRRIPFLPVTLVLPLSDQIARV